MYETCRKGANVRTAARVQVPILTFIPARPHTATVSSVSVDGSIE